MEKQPMLEEEGRRDHFPQRRGNILTAPITVRVSIIALLALAVYGLLVAVNKTSAAMGGIELGIRNTTLGFGAILLLSLPGRADRRDAMSLIASASDIEITKHIRASRGSDVSLKARPPGDADIAEGYWGSWRTHMDALRYVVDNHIETALILEDDVDWYA